MSNSIQKTRTVVRRTTTAETGNIQDGRAPFQPVSSNQLNVTTVSGSTKRVLLDQVAKQQQQQQRATRYHPRVSRTTSHSHTTHNNSAHSQAQIAQQRDLESWRARWKELLRKNSCVYFEIDEKRENDRKRVALAFKALGAQITSFFSENVTILISTRTFSRSANYAQSDIFRIAKMRQDMKVWNYEKVYRFMENLDFPVPELDSIGSAKLASLLQKEKLYGPNDRDPNAKRDDIKYFSGIYLHVYDLRQKTRPVAVREWTTGKHPNLYHSVNGRSLFLEENKLNTESDRLRRSKRRLLDLEKNRKYRDDLIRESYSSTCTDKLSYDERVQLRFQWEQQMEEPCRKKQKLNSNYSKGEVIALRAGGLGLHQNSIGSGTSTTTNQNEYGEIAASGLAQSGSTVIHGNGGGNGLGPTGSSVANRQLSVSKRKMVEMLNTAPVLQRRRSSRLAAKSQTGSPIKRKTHADRVENAAKIAMFDRIPMTPVAEETTPVIPSPDDSVDRIISGNSKSISVSIPHNDQPSPLKMRRSSSDKRQRSRAAIEPPRLKIASAKLASIKKESRAYSAVTLNKSINPIPKLVAAANTTCDDTVSVSSDAENEYDKTADNETTQIYESNTNNTNVTTEGDESQSQKEPETPISRHNQLQHQIAVKTNAVSQSQPDSFEQEEESESESEFEETVTTKEDTHIEEQHQEEDDDDSESESESEDNKAKIGDQLKRLHKKFQDRRVPIMKKKELKPGYCENCRVKYDDFDEHIWCEKHRMFAENDDNFKDIDDLIKTVNTTRTLQM
ncbi:unnamed protein product [Ambrosiozyma monospora]|uniref:Unnamed protein product n=1 Tax=Ambrosiozyma monospora TaxID=43982 RepID=A0A9W6YSN5_AMBMO|nr:unnamed protein product [Ambrosiozyma monospora]